MLELTVGPISAKTVLTFEHSLLSLSKWEEKFSKAFLSREPKSHDEMLEYYRMMLLSPGDPDLVYTLTPDHFDTLSKYLSMTPGCTPPPKPDPDAPRHTGELTTGDIIYMRMTLLRIPWQPAETWHLNRLMLQIALVADAQKPPKKENPSGLLQKWSNINEQNKQFFNSDG